MEHSVLPLANVITLGARDLRILRKFYRDLGWPQVIDSDDYAVFELRGTILALFPSKKLAADGGEEPDHGRGGIRFTIGIMAEHPGDVDDMAARARRAGGRVTKEPADAEYFEGRSAYFADPESNFWEIAWAPPDNPVIAASRRAAQMSFRSDQ